MRRLLLASCLLLVAVSSEAAPILPAAPGTTWSYNVGGVPGTARAVAHDIVRIAGVEEIDGRKLLRLETSRDDALLKTELVAIEKGGLLCYRRTLPDGKTAAFDPPQLLFPEDLQIGKTWSVDDSSAGSERHEQFKVVAEENLRVPAGKFRAFRIESEQPWPLSTSRQIWVVPGVGIVAETTTARSPSGRLLSRITSALASYSPATPDAESSKEQTPSAEWPPPTPTPAPPEPTIQLEIAAAREGPAVAELPGDTANIFVRWRGENLPINSTVRIAWIAEDVGDVAPPNFVVDETERTVTTTNFGARFTLSRPKDGWAPGKYRAELYLEEKLLATQPVTIRE